jgi:hypothetical protein
MTLYLTDNTRRRDPRAGQPAWWRGQALPGRRHHQQRCRRHRHPQDLRHAGGDAARGPAAAGARRGDRPEVDVFDREAVFIERVMQPLRRDFPALKVVFEHITTREAAQYVAGGRSTPRPRSPRTTCSTTATRCSPAACARTTTACRCSSARCTARRWCEAATSGSPKFFLGTDSAPHARGAEGAASAAPAATPRRPRSSCTPRPSRRPARWTAGSLRQPPRPDFYGLPRQRGTGDPAPHRLADSRQPAVRR